MTCPKCFGKTTVVESVHDVDTMLRRRKCLECGRFFYTTETDIDFAEGDERIRYLRNQRYQELKKIRKGQL